MNKTFNYLFYSTIFIFAFCCNAVNAKIQYSCTKASLSEPNNCHLKVLANHQLNPPADMVIEANGKSFKISSEQLLYQELAFRKSALGQELNALKEFDKSNAKFVKESSSVDLSQKTNDIKEFDAIEAIKGLAKKHQIVMLNEAHHISYHRIFALSVAKILKGLGFNHIAVEAISEANFLNDAGYPITSTGYYVADPEFAYFLREARKLGFKFIAYDSDDENREQAQSDNLKKFIQENPNTKLFVYAGYSHIRERSPSGTTKWMAERFKKDTGIDPLTIDQVGGTPRFVESLQDPIYQLAKDINIEKSFVLRNSDNDWLVSSKYKNSVDITVIHPIEIFNNSRVYLSSEKQPYNLDISNTFVSRPVVVNAFLVDEWQKHGIKSIPIDSKLVESKNGTVQLMLPKGVYQVTLESKDASKILKKIAIK